MAYHRGTDNQPCPRVVITGVGLVTCFGHGWQTNVDGFRTGRIGIRTLTAFDASRQRTQQAGEVRFTAPVASGHLTRRQLARLDRATRQLVEAGLECLTAAAWPTTFANIPVPFSFGTSAAAMTSGETYYRTKTATPHRQRHLAHLAQQYQPVAQIRQLADALGLAGPVHVIANACASGSNAIGHAARLIQSGRARRVIAGGYDGLSELVYAGFDTLQALSITSPRPFAADRDGLALGEGAAVFTLERLDDARARNAQILGEVAGYGSATDLHHLTQPHPQGDAALRTMIAATQQAGWTPEQVDYINAHGTGTPLNDSSEGHAICRWAGNATASTRVSSVKGSIGHLLGGAGAVEAALCLMALQGGWIPPNVPLDNPDPVCQFQLIQHPTDAPLRRVLSNSFGFGGANATLALQHPELLP